MKELKIILLPKKKYWQFWRGHRRKHEKVDNNFIEQTEYLQNNSMGIYHLRQEYHD